ncbi:hypothetical protein PMIN01_09637 [Paraphaeosphaeria minitans]|uniref:Uncharacterized protein n=1 Tax=Paraphaeosphaeria minitans TaxID=565426 RepID=A0A9P6GC99_9PLEO|nr:hypothetical protein PMIN01_09637 [Paraphaeosphaeria minitans]
MARIGPALGIGPHPSAATLVHLAAACGVLYAASMDRDQEVENWCKVGFENDRHHPLQAARKTMQKRATLWRPGCRGPHKPHADGEGSSHSEARPDRACGQPRFISGFAQYSEREASRRHAEERRPDGSFEARVKGTGAKEYFGGLASTICAETARQLHRETVAPFRMRFQAKNKQGIVRCAEQGATVVKLYVCERHDSILPAVVGEHRCQMGGEARYDLLQAELVNGQGESVGVQKGLECWRVEMHYRKIRDALVHSEDSGWPR